VFKDSSRPFPPLSDCSESEQIKKGGEKMKGPEENKEQG